MLYRIDLWWGRLLTVMMAASAVYIGFFAVAIVYISVMRWLGIRYNPVILPIIEYGFVYILFLGSPWLTRHRGHIFIELLTVRLPQRFRDLLSRLICLVCALVCFIWAYYSFRQFLLRWNDPMEFDTLRADLDIRLWIATIPIAFGSLLTGIEFLRFSVVKVPMHAPATGDSPDIVH